MKKLIASTAMVLALALPATVFADTAATLSPASANAFLTARGSNQLLATDLMGHDVYARRTPVDIVVAGQSSAPLPTMTAKDTDSMDKVGNIEDLVIANDGSVAAIVVGVGGFLGVGQRDIAVSMQEVSFAVNADNPKDLYVVLNTTGEMLKTSPVFDRTVGNAVNAADVASATNTAVAANPSTAPVLQAPQITRDGYNAVKLSDISVDTLIGKNVYGKDDKSVGTVDDVKVDATGAVQNVIIDFGGFLGMGTTKVALTFDELTILANADKDIRVYVDATKDQIRALPVYVTN